MPLSQHISDFLSNMFQAMKTPEMLAADEKQREFNATQQLKQRELDTNTDYYNRQLAQSGEEARARILAGLVPYGYGEAAAGGQGLTSTQPQMPSGNAAAPAPQDDVLKKLYSPDVYDSIFGAGQQGQTGHAVNGAAQVAPSTTPGNRLPGANPAAPSMGALGPLFNLGNLAGRPLNVQQFGASNEESPSIEFTVPPSMTGGSAPQKIKVPINKDTNASTVELLKLFGGGTKPSKLGAPEAQMRSAAQQVAQAHGLPIDQFEHPNDLPVDMQKEAWSNYNDLRMTDLEKQQKQELLDAEKEKNKQFAEARASDSAVMDLLKRDPMYFDHKHIPDQKQYDRILTQAAEQGVKLPTRTPTPKMDEASNTADELQMQTKRIESLAQQVGWQNFGAIIGRLKIGEGKIGEPLITIDKPSAKGTPQAQLESELRDHLNFLTLQETKLFGGGRTAVMLVNMVKTTSPQQWQSQPLFQGALTAAYNRAQITKNAVKRYAFGDTDEASAQSGMAAAGGPLPKDHFVGERVYHPGQKKFYTVKEVLPGNKIRTEEE